MCSYRDFCNDLRARNVDNEDDIQTKTKENAERVMIGKQG